MRPFAFVPFALACAAAAPAPAPAQTGHQPNLLITIVGGAGAGHGLWTVEHQPICVIGGGGACTTNYDTLRISRQIGSSLVLGVAATYFPWPNAGFHAEVSYLGLPLDDSCAGVSYAGSTNAGDTAERNRQMCDDIQARAGFGGAISVFVGATLRAAARGTISPYVRGSIGIVNHARSTIDVVGAFDDGTGAQERQVILDPSPRHTSTMFGVAAGFSSPLGSGYQFRFEVRDVVTSLERVAGPANGIAIAPVSTRTYHHFAFTLGFDVVLERSRGRRY